MTHPLDRPFNVLAAIDNLNAHLDANAPAQIPTPSPRQSAVNSPEKSNLGASPPDPELN